MGRQEILLHNYIKHMSTHTQPIIYSEDVHITSLYSLSLEEYVNVRFLVCKAEHLSCTECPSMLQIADDIIVNGHCRLSDSFRKAFPSVPYKTDIARRKVLQMPLVSIRLRDELGRFVWYLFKYIHGTDYRQFSEFAQTVVKSSFGTLKPFIQREEVKGLLQLAGNNKERELIRCAIYKSSGISSTAARRMFGFEGMGLREKAVDQAIDQVQAIHEEIDDLTSKQGCPTVIRCRCRVFWLKL